MHLLQGVVVSPTSNKSSPSSPGDQHANTRMGNCLSHGSKKVGKNYKSRSNHSRHTALVVPLDHQVHSYASEEKEAGAGNIALSKRELEEPPVTSSPSPPRLKKTVRFAADTFSSQEKEKEKEKEMEAAKRVKVVMTKEAAALLLSMLADGKGMRVEEMLCQLNQQRSSWIATGSSAGGRETNGCWTPGLETIPEI